MTIYFTPGPTQLHPSAAKHMQQALQDGVFSISHRSPEFETIFKAAANGVKSVLGAPSDWHVFFLGSATECMERLVQNCSGKYSYHFVNGAFSKKFFEAAKDYQRQTQSYQVNEGQGFEFNNLQIDPNNELICLTQNETSTGVWTDPKYIKDIRKACPNALIAIDIVSAAPYVKLNFNDFDAAFFSIQKGFGLAAGMGVLLVNQKCLDKAQNLEQQKSVIGSFHNFKSLLKEAQNNQTPATPNVLYIYLLGKICQEYLTYGVDKIRTETKTKADTIYNFFDNHKKFSPFIKIIEQRSPTVATINLPQNLTSAELITKLRQNGFDIGTGYGTYKNSQVRISNFPMHQIADLKVLLRLFDSF